MRHRQITANSQPTSLMAGLRGHASLASPKVQPASDSYNRVEPTYGGSTDNPNREANNLATSDEFGHPLGYKLPVTAS